MAYAAVTSLKGTLHLHFLQSQPRFPLQHNQQILISLHQNLGFLQEVLEKSEIAYNNSAMKDLEAEMRDVAFEAEERIEMELSSIYLQSSSIDEACLLRLDGILKQAVKQTDYLKKKLIKIQSKQQFAKGPSILGRMRQRGLLLGSTSSQPADPERENNITVSKFSKNASKFDSRMVGCDKEFKTILDKLTQQSAEHLQVVSIVGMGGIGKTTLAREVYKDPSITSYFYKKAWVTVSQEYDVEQMLQCFTDCVNPASNDIPHKQRNDNSKASVRKQSRKQRIHNLSGSLRKHLKDQRYLIVMDDIWSTTAWDSVQRCFPDDNNGSRILLTSRLREVAEYASSGNSTINLSFLNDNESWNLYCNVFGQTEFLSMFEQIGRNIVKKCNGLPLAIIVIASLLSKTEETVEKWSNVAENVSRYVSSDSNDACSRILCLSYNQLPHHLKACFLYFGVFPEDYEIHVKKLARLWAAEGFLKAEDHPNIEDPNMEEVAMECLQDLVDRSLVFVNKQSYNGKMKTIRIHDLLRDLCLREARHENLLNVIGDEKLPFYKKKISCRWTSATSSFHLLSLTKCFHKSHSFHYHNDYYYESAERLFSHFKLLRVLDIECICSDRYEELYALANLIHLRYLALKYSIDRTMGRYSHLELFEHWNMQSFIVRKNGGAFDSFEAYGIWKMPLLRNFCIEWIVSLGTLPVVHRNLESISWLHPKLCTKDLFTRIPNLKKLGIIDGGLDENNDGGSDENNLDCFYNFVNLGQLEELSIRGWKFNHIPCSGIAWATSFLPNLKKLKFFWTSLAWSDMRLIGMLPNLEVLKLINAIASEDTMWEPYEEGFRQLKRLVIEDKYGRWKHWNAVGDHFPLLECLELRECKYLQEIPSGFADIITLALIQLNGCGDSVLASAKLIQEEQYNNYGNALLVRSENIRTKGSGNSTEEEWDVQTKGSVYSTEEEWDVEEESDLSQD
ncbi:late blight resistance protein R1-A-like isoform X1 [Ipomoea triloba]|uniref:late blight resistance protein R1-A-like isoform X1 n=1 Tax=Ipomoea triloba TaxID=35885 RepID=UPI00125E011D|nr:late blight resistance protein R1-A-like isoform X1 [Ipomoea triloba]XP_031092223.1 late blight resistance protein R1-A-like isoform X1 [Ipomoea triloba]XP_031092224.1 late blight resistance protein R1-A-like isoform X1 [Ipomoea triloba]